MIQCLKHKAKERPERRRGNKVNELLPPHLEQPGQRSMAYRTTHECHICCDSFMAQSHLTAHISIKRADHKGLTSSTVPPNRRDNELRRPDEVTDV